jgi:ligand-binding sensor domain-containing protein
MKNLLKTLFITVVLLNHFLLPVPAAAQSQKLRFERLTIEDGLSQNAILAIAQDTQGFLWFGTEDGLNKYDGYQFTVFKHDPDDPASLVDSFVSEILVDGNGEIWIGTRSGLDRYDTASGSFIHYPMKLESEPYLQGAWVISLYEDRQGTLWVGTEEEGLNRLDRSNGTFSNHLDETEEIPLLRDNAARVIYEDSAGEMWVGTHDGMYHFDRVSGDFTQFSVIVSPDEAEINDISVIYEDQYDNLWVGSEGGGISRFDPATGTFIRFAHDPDDPHSLSNNRVRAIFQDQLGNFWIGTQNGLNLVPAEDFSPSGAALEFLHYGNDPYDPDSLSSDVVWSIFEDRSGVMWFGTWGGGLSKYNRSTDRFKLYQHDPNQPGSLSDNMIWAIMEASDQRIWVGSLNGGLNVLDRAKK